MKTDERIIKYIENELTPEERVAFEFDLKNSSQLKEKFGKYLRVKIETDELKKLKLNPLYLDSILPGFRDRLDDPKTLSFKRNLGYAFGVMLIFIISIVILKNIFDNKTELTDLQQFTESLSENQRIALLEELNGDSYEYELISENISEIELTNLAAAGLEIKNEVAETYNISYKELMEGLSDIEVENIYSEILNRKF